MARRYHILFSFIFILLHSSCFSFDFSRINVAWQYDPNAEIKVNSRVTTSEEVITVFFKIEADTISDWASTFYLQEGYESESEKILSGYSVDTLFKEVDNIILSISFKRPSEDLLVLKISDTKINYFFDTSISIGSLSFPSIYPVDQNRLPIFTNYINDSNALWSGNDAFYSMQYNAAFDRAQPPMGEMQPLAPSITMDHSFIFQDSARFLENHFYVTMADSTELTGVTMLKTSPYFPAYKKLEELVESMLYITTEAEEKAIINSRNPKQAFDAFWLKTYKTKFRARNSIRNYYKLVEVANHYFTDFKPGWKTDRGMISIVYGMPDEVYRTENKEEWVYHFGPSFEFTIISTFFAPKTYALRRNIELETSWLESIAAMRREIHE